MSFRYFVIGSGSIGRRHADNLNALGANVTHYGWRGIDLETVISEIAACHGQAGVVIATATKIRLPLITECAKAGAALYIEKPVAYRTKDVEHIFDLPKATLERSVAGFMMRYHPMVRRLLHSPVRDIFRASFEIGHDVTQWRQNWSFADSYAADPDGGGVLLDLCHEIDLAYLLCGAAPLSTVTSLEHPDFVGVDIASTLDFTSPDGRNIRVAMDYLAPSLIRRGHIVGLDQEIEYDIANANLTQVTKDARVAHNLDQERNAMFLDFMSDFMALTQGKEPENPHIPRLDRVKDVCHVIAQAWEMREFTGQLKANLT
jgi:predicted dehydrogenase